jgi:transcriptional regulator with XRE-family HTH domain
MFNTWLQGKMKVRGWEDKDAAKALEVDVSTIGRWLKGASLPERKQVARICDVFKVSPVMILRWTDPEILLQETKEAERQNNRAAILAQIPEVADAVDALQRMTPERRAAMLMLLKGSEE